MKKTDDDIKRIIRYFETREEVSALYLFGSLAKGRTAKGSDIDIAVLVNEEKLRKKGFEPLRRDYYKASPAFSLRTVDIVILNTASPFFKYHVLKTGRILFDSNRKLRVNFTANSIIEYLDFKPIEDIFNRAISKRFNGSTIGR